MRVRLVTDNIHEKFRDEISKEMFPCDECKEPGYVELAPENSNCMECRGEVTLCKSCLNKFIVKLSAFKN